MRDYVPLIGDLPGGWIYEIPVVAAYSSRSLSKGNIAGAVNPESKILMLGHALGTTPVHVQFRLDHRNARGRAAVANLSTEKEGVLRRDTWT